MYFVFAQVSRIPRTERWGGLMARTGRAIRATFFSVESVSSVKKLELEGEKKDVNVLKILPSLLLHQFIT